MLNESNLWYGIVYIFAFYLICLVIYMVVVFNFYDTRGLWLHFSKKNFINVLLIGINCVMSKNTCTQAAIRFLQRNTKFYSCIQTAIRSLIRNTNFLKLLQNRHLRFDNKFKKSKVASKLPFVFCPRNTKFEVVLKRSLVFWLQTTKIELSYFFSELLITRQKYL